jgi:hypothetical protein
MPKESTGTIPVKKFLHTTPFPPTKLLNFRVSCETEGQVLGLGSKPGKLRIGAVRDIQPTPTTYLAG